MNMKKLAYVLIAMILASGANCSGDGHVPDDAPIDENKAASVAFRLQVLGPDIDTLMMYSDNVEWQGDLVSGVGSAGEDSPIYLFKTYSDYIGFDGDYVISDFVWNKRPGTWHFKVTTDNWTVQCTADLAPGVITSVNFTRGKDTCTTGFLFP
jgi:hypothetical protein